jgi:diacylglycerol kinase (ATP)
MIVPVRNLEMNVKHMKQVAIIFNPRAGSIKGNISRIETLRVELKKLGFECADEFWMPTSRAGEAAELVSKAVKMNANVIVICGGDGTINEAVQVIVGSDIPLAILPAGTANVLAKEMSLPTSPEGLAELIARNSSRRISVGLAENPATKWKRYFLLMAGIGIDAAIIEAVNPQLKKQFGIGSYIAAGLKTLADWKLTPFDLRANKISYPATFAVIANAANYAAWFKISPDSKMESDSLNLCAFNSTNRITYLGYAAMSLFGAHTKAANVVYEPISEIFAESEVPVPVQLDGELVGHLPMKFSIVPNALTVVAP